MPQLTERDALRHSPEQATALVRVLDLQAEWDGLLVDKAQKTTLLDLRARQNASDAYQAALRDYSARYRDAGVPEPTHAVPARLAAWCRVLRVVFGRAEGDCPARLMGKVYRLADRVAARVGREPVRRGPAADLPAAARELDVVIAWCGLEPMMPPPDGGQSLEVGGRSA
jgi:hypothetical protein